MAIQNFTHFKDTVNYKTSRPKTLDSRMVLALFIPVFILTMAGVEKDREAVQMRLLYHTGLLNW